MLQQLLENFDKPNVLLKYLDFDINWKESDNHTVFEKLIEEKKFNDEREQYLILELLYRDYLISQGETVDHNAFMELEKNIANSKISHFWISIVKIVKGKNYMKLASDIALVCFIEAYDSIRNFEPISMLYCSLVVKIASLMENQGNNFGAMSYYFELLSNCSTFPEITKRCCRELAKLYFNRGLYDHTKYYLARLYALYPDDFDDDMELTELQISVAIYSGEQELVNYYLSISKENTGNSMLRTIISVNQLIKNRLFDQALSNLLYLKMVQNNVSEVSDGYLGLKIGELYLLTNKLDSAKEYLKKSLNIFRKQQHYQGLIEANKILGQLYYFSNDYRTSLNYLLDALSLINRTNSIREIFPLLFYIINIKIKLNLKFEIHLDSIKKWGNFTLNEQSLAEKLLCEVAVKFHQKSLISNGQAMELLDQLATMNFDDIHLHLYSSYYRSQLLLLELIIYKTDTSSERAKMELSVFYKKSNRYQNRVFMIYALMLRVQYYIITSDLENAYKLLTQVEISVQEYQILFFEEQLTELKSLLNKQVLHIMSSKSKVENLYQSILISNMREYLEFFRT